MPKMLKKSVFFAILVFLVPGLFAAPLKSGFALAPVLSASQQEKDLAYTQARQRVIEASRKYEGTPYLYTGISSRGLDCSGLIYISFKDALGVNLPRSASALFSWVERITFDNAQPGDLLFFRTGSTRAITHVALYLGNRRFIHSASAGAKTGVIYSSLNERYWANAYAGTGRAIPASN
ncbi:MAG: C40 family peptidase [Treponema sp.]|nr:C40 family peptidase [Treponema sp.]